VVCRDKGGHEGKGGGMGREGGGGNLIGHSAEGLKRMPVMQSAVDFAAADARVHNVGQSVPATRILIPEKKWRSKAGDGELLGWLELGLLKDLAHDDQG
jgi:hypothetical protein